MVTLLKTYFQTVEGTCGEYAGLSTDTEPTCLNGSTLYCIDEGKTYHYDEDNEGWYDETGTAKS